MKSDNDIFDDESPQETNNPNKSKFDEEESEGELSLDKKNNVLDKDVFSLYQKSKQKLQFVDKNTAIDKGDYIEFEGQKFDSFSLRNELNEGQFDKNGNFIPKEMDEDNESDHTYSDETSENEGDNLEYLISNLTKLIPLIHPYDNAQDALIACGNSNSEKLIAITEACTELIDLGLITIYSEPVDKLQKQLNTAEKGYKQKKSEPENSEKISKTDAKDQNDANQTKS